MNRYKLFSIRFFQTSIFFLFLYGLVNFIIDPYQQFRISNFYDIYYGANERYLLPGLIKNEKYNDIVIGSSMVENFKISNVEEILNYNNVIKLPLEGATSLEINYILESVFKNKKEIKHILYGLDLFSFSGDINRTKIKPYPLYLYDENKLDKYQYLLNIDTLKECFMIPLRKFLKKNDLKYKYDNMFQWQHLYSDKDFTKQKLLNEWFSRDSKYKYNYLKRDYKLNNLINHFEKHIYPYIKLHPNTHFDIFFPPYSILTYKLMLEKSILDNSILFKIYLFKKLSSIKNVSLYDFQLDKNITETLSNYRDIGHYSQTNSLQILQNIQKGNHKVDDLIQYDKDLSLWKENIFNYEIKK
jgi:hypothetical protein